MRGMPVRVLLVDDDSDDYALTRDYFADMNGQGYTLEWASSYEAGLAAMQSGQYDVYLLDYQLGAKTGLELLQAGRAAGASGAAIMLTGRTQRELDLEAMEQGAADFLEKGRLDAAILERSIRYALEQKRHREELEQRVAERTAELAQAIAALQEADRRKDEFLATLAHELRNPLAPLKNSLDLLRMSHRPAAEIEATCELMDRQVRQLIRLVNDLMDVARITRGTLDLKRETIDLCAALDSAVETSRPVIEAAGHRLHVDRPSAPVWLQADSTRLSQIISNLLNNAARYTNAGGIIWLSGAVEGNEAVVRVRDTGIGISAGMLPRVFEPFTQVDTSLERSQGGLGIGLSLVQRLVQLHGGTVRAVSPGLGQGAEFVVRLPLSAPADQTRRAADSNQSSGVMPSHRIIIVDDMRAAAHMLARLLEAIGQHVLTFDNPADALEAARSDPPDVIISDIAMPGMDGYQFARQLRAEPRLDQTVLVAVTGFGQESDRRQALEAGFQRHFVKPIGLNDLRELLANLGDGGPRK